MKYFLSFVSGLVLPTAGILFALTSEYGGLLIGYYMPFALIVNILLSIITKLILKEKYSFLAAFFGGLTPIFIILPYIAYLNITDPGLKPAAPQNYR